MQPDDSFTTEHLLQASKVQEKFRLDLSDEAAVQYFKEVNFSTFLSRIHLKSLAKVLDASVSAVFAQLAEKVHQWAQYWRK